MNEWKSERLIKPNGQGVVEKQKLTYDDEMKWKIVGKREGTVLGKQREQARSLLAWETIIVIDGVLLAIINEAKNCLANRPPNSRSK